MSKDKCEGHISLPREIAIRRMSENCRFRRRSETVSLIDALDRVSSSDVYARHTLPNLLSSRMDGIAVRCADFENGMPDTSGWQAGDRYIFCNTGIGISGDYDTVYPIEEADFDEAGRLNLKALPEKGQYTTPPGSNIREGDLLIEAGARLTPILLSTLAAGGYTAVGVIKKPTVAFLPTGSELVAPGAHVPPGKNTDSNSVMMQAKLLCMGAEPLMFPITPDDPELLRRQLVSATEQADIVVINAGSSKGTDDFTVEVLESVGRIIFHETDHGPGKHTSFTVAENGVPVVGLSGPPGGMESTADFYVMPLVDKFLRRPQEPAPTAEAVLTEDADMQKPVEFFLRVKAERRDGKILATPIYTKSLKDMDRANAFLRLPPFGRYPAGSRVIIELRHPYRSI